MSDEIVEKAEAVYNGELMRAFLETPLAKASKKAGLSLTLADYLNWKSTLTSSKPHPAEGTPKGFQEPKRDSTAMHKERWNSIVSKAKERKLNNWQAVLSYLQKNNLKVKGNSIADDVEKITDYNHQNALIQMEG